MRPQHTISVPINSATLRLKQYKVLLLAILGSVLLHILLLSEFSISLPQLFNNQQTLEMHLVQQQAKPINAPAPDKKNIVDTKRKVPKTRKITKPSSAVESTKPETIPAAADQATSSTNTGQSGTEVENDTGSSSEDSAVTLQEDEHKRTVYNHVETEFEVKRGTDASAAGATKTVFNIDADGHYSIISTTKAKGLASLFFSNLTMKSEGSVTENGLKPDFYSYQYSGDQSKIQSASFFWSDRIIIMRSAKGEKTAPLTTGTQDFLSFMYQFMFSPPLENTEITMTNGKRLSTYTYSFTGEERITTKIGELNTIHLLKQGDDEEKTELWLATDYQYLPIKIRKTEKDGSVIEQSVINISTQRPS